MQGDIYGRKLALLTRKAGADAAQLHTGIIAFTQCELLLDRGLRKRPLRLRSEWISRVESVAATRRTASTTPTSCCRSPMPSSRTRNARS